MRSKQYSSITAAMAVLPLSFSARTTRPVQFTSTSVSVPRTAAGRMMRKRISVPTSSGAPVWNSTPPAEMSDVSAKYSRASTVLTVIGNLSGKRTELRDSVTCAPLDERVYRHADCRKITLVFPRTGRTCADVDGLKFGYFGEIKAAYLHRRSHHVKRLFAAGAHRF